jgi:hypothetical protein
MRKLLSLTLIALAVFLVISEFNMVAGQIWCHSDWNCNTDQGWVCRRLREDPILQVCVCARAEGCRNHPRVD